MVEGNWLLGFVLSDFPLLRKTAADLATSFLKTVFVNSPATLQLHQSLPFAAHSSTGTTVCSSLIYESEPHEGDGVSQWQPKLAAAVHCAAGTDFYLKLSYISGGRTFTSDPLLFSSVKESRSFVAILRYKERSVRATVLSAPRPVPLPLYTSHPLSQTYCFHQDRPGSTGLFVEEQTAQPLIHLQVVGAFLHTITSQMDTALAAWRSRLIRAKIRQRAFANAREAGARGFLTVHIELRQLRAAPLNAVTGTDKSARIYGSSANDWAGDLSGCACLEVMEESADPRTVGQFTLPRLNDDRVKTTSDKLIINFHDSITTYIAGGATAFFRLTLTVNLVKYAVRLPLHEEMQFEQWMPMDASNPSATLAFDALLTVCVRPVPEDVEALPDEPFDVDNYLFNPYSWFWLVGLPGSNPLATDDEELHCAFADLCDNLLPANSIDQYIADLAAFKSALQKTASDCSEPTSLHAFRSSRDKKSPELQAFPVNFHVQLLQVSDGTGELLGVAHSLTSGCMSTHMFSHAKGGLSRLETQYFLEREKLQELRETTHSSGILSDKLLALEFSTLALAKRKVFALSQTLAIAITGLYLKLQMSALGLTAGAEDWLDFGFPILFEGLLSLLGKEQGMVEDCVVAIEALRLFTIQIMPSTVATPCVSMSCKVISLFVPMNILSSLPAAYSEAAIIRFVPFYLNQGIDLVQSLATGKAQAEQQLHQAFMSLASKPSTDAEMLKSTTAFKMQHELTQRSLQRLNQYFHTCRRIESTDIDGLDLNAPVHPLLQKLFETFASNDLSIKNVDLLMEAAIASYSINACKVTFCKSGKDRTGMAITLEQSRILGDRFGCGTSQERVLADANNMRVYGTRIMIAEKNIGRRVYSINKLQVQFMPLLYRPPYQVCEDMMKTDET